MSGDGTPTDPIAAAVLPVVTIDDPAIASGCAQALRDGGLPVAEVVLRTPAAMDALRAMADVRGFTVGAGTVLDPDDVDAAVDDGARFIVSPGLDPRVVERGLALGIPVVPGVATPTELMAAMRMGLGLVKVFPIAQLGGVRYLKSLAAPFPAVRFAPSGGIALDDVPGYLDLPNVVTVCGSWMVPSDALAAGDLDRVRELARLTVNRIAA